MPSELIPPPYIPGLPNIDVFVDIKFGQYPGELEYTLTLDAIGTSPDVRYSVV
jgi:hypothetical protein